jgi:lactate dehydrogenase-like 2-hydroxyacid dehydrogenase
MKKIGVSAISTIIGAAAGAGVASKYVGEELTKAQNMSNKHFALFKMMNQWVRVKQEGKNLSTYFETNGYKKIAIYGMSFAGETLLEELKDTGIQVAYAIDKNANALYADVDIVSMDDTLEDVDAIVVTAITFFDEIEEELSEKIDCPILSLEDILYEI